MTSDLLKWLDNLKIFEKTFCENEDNRAKSFCGGPLNASLSNGSKYTSGVRAVYKEIIRRVFKLKANRMILPK